MGSRPSSLKALTQAARALVDYAAGMVDRAALGDKAANARLELLTPLAKAYGTDCGIEVAILGIQAADSVGRKLGLECGETLARLIADMRAGAEEAGLRALIDACEEVAQRLASSEVDDRLAASYPFMTMLSVAVSGWVMERRAAGRGRQCLPQGEARDEPLLCRAGRPRGDRADGGDGAG